MVQVALVYQRARHGVTEAPRWDKPISLHRLGQRLVGMKTWRSAAALSCSVKEPAGECCQV
jgi:hypothetical protein